ncbi:MAG: hypothetical protein QM630_01130 [Microbacterium sp.]
MIGVLWAVPALGSLIALLLLWHAETKPWGVAEAFETLFEKVVPTPAHELNEWTQSLIPVRITTASLSTADALVLPEGAVGAIHAGEQTYALVHASRDTTDAMAVTLDACHAATSTPALSKGESK